MISLFIAFFVKHYICDFPLQRWPYMYANKGSYGHLGGILHALIHAIGTALVCSIYAPHYILIASLIDFGIHYHVDWAKMKIGKIHNLKPDSSEWYWHLLGLDQLLHYLTYAWIIYLIYI